ncbi:Phosphoribulokinase [Tritrichomonas foetus]|uniref:Phosphoribulokinase n=1 Tax=Tritrichomonas foetus TaxID=1144522 RepID=A0A1J4KSY3_9EUKA|nr:Phosphoribulokinase [Tritrichomonas foetus]|eukprot:OHT13992.1 Phosphoribulokinase [Tritrichomonas foetus]
MHIWPCFLGYLRYIRPNSISNNSKNISVEIIIFDFIMNKRSTETRQQLISEHDTLSFLIWAQYSKLFNRLLKLEHAYCGALYYTDLSGHEITEDMVAQLEKSIRNILTTDTPIEIVQKKKSEMIEYFAKKGMADKVGVLKTIVSNTIDCIQCGNHIDYILEPHSVDKTRLQIFSLKKYLNGFVVTFPSLTNLTEASEWKEPKLLQQMISSYSDFIRSTGIDTVSKLNEIIFKNKFEKLKVISEYLHDKQIADIARRLCDNFEHKRVITIAGPSSSNKTTFAKRLELALAACGHKTLVIEMDDYFVDEKDSPLDEDGNMDWESVDCINILVLAERVNALVRGETVKRRKFDWVRCISVDSDEEMTLKPGHFLIMEGIHGLNPKLLNALGQDNVTPIYVQPTTPINIDHNHRFPCSDYRMIRRFIRDHNFRNFPSRSTIDIWSRVRYGEMVNIFPYQENAEYFFNSALIYELPVLTMQGRLLLAEASVPTDKEDAQSPSTIALNNEIIRLNNLMNLFYPIPLDVVHKTSCIREFLGGSDLKY